MDINARLMNYFNEYGQAFRDGAKLSGFYGDCAMAATPTFVGCLKGEAEVRTALLSVAQEQVRIGMQSLVPLQIETTVVDAMHAWARVHWGAKFQRTGDRVIEFDISYLVRKNGDRFLILLYIAHQDEQEMRRDLGLS